MKKSLLEEFVSNNEVEVISEFAQARMQGGVDITGMIWDGIKWVAISTAQMFENFGNIMTNGSITPTQPVQPVQTGFQYPSYLPTPKSIDSISPGGMIYGIKF